MSSSQMEEQQPIQSVPNENTSLLNDSHTPEKTQVMEEGKPSDAIQAELDDGHQKPTSMTELFLEFAILSWVAFGGPPAHFGFYQRRFVENKRWLLHSVYAELIALSQCLPGPSSTQTAFALGALRRGVPGGLLSGVSFQHAGLLLMSLCGIYGANLVNEDDENNWVDALTSSLSSGGVGLVIDASYNLVAKLCQERLTQVICTLCAALAYLFTKPWLLPLLIFAGGVTTALKAWIGRKMSASAEDEDEVEEGDQLHNITAVTGKLGISVKSGLVLVALWVVLLVVSISLNATIEYKHAPELHWFSSFLRVGSFIFGGGFVAMPLLISELEANGRELVSQKQFLTGLALVQSAPGPLFNFSAYLGAVLARNENRNLFGGIAVCWTGLFGPGVLLIFAALSFWSSFRQLQVYRNALNGFNAAAAGLLVAAAVQLYERVRNVSPFERITTLLVMLSFAAVRIAKVPAPLVIMLAGALGVAVFYAAKG